MSTEPSNQLSPVKRFASGLLVGLFCAGIFWLYTIFFNVDIPLLQAVAGSIVLAVSCGAIALTSGLDKLFENLPLL